MDKFFPGLGQNALTAAEYAALGPMLGAVKMDSYGNKYKFVKCDNVNGYGATGKPMGVRTAGASESDMSDDLAASTAGKIRGFSASKFSGSYVYGWMMIEGDLETALDGQGMTLTSDGNVAADQVLYWGADGVVHGVAVALAAGTDVTTIGITPVADSSTSITIGRITPPAAHAGG